MACLRLEDGAADSIPLAGRTLRIVGMKDEDADQAPLLVVEAENRAEVV